MYCPLAHMVWGSEGGIFKSGAIDFAGGLVVHMSSGYSALVLCLMLGKRTGFGKDPMPPHSLPLCLIGAGLLWTGWFGFNAGSALSASPLAAMAFVNTSTAASAATLLWALIEWAHRGKATALGGATAAVAGLVAITPACGNVSPMGAIMIGCGVAVVSYLACGVLKPALGYDDSLDVFGVHALGGTWGALASGIFAVTLGSGIETNGQQILVQLTGIGFTAVYAPVATAIIVLALQLVFGSLRATVADEVEGLDLSQHTESAYGFSGGSVAPAPEFGLPSGATAPARVLDHGTARCRRRGRDDERRGIATARRRARWEGIARGLRPPGDPRFWRCASRPSRIVVAWDLDARRARSGIGGGLVARGQLFARKQVSVLLAELAGEHQLRRVLGPVSLTALGVGAIIGAGIFVLTGLAANQFAGPGLALSFVVAGIGCALAALCYAEFAAMVPVAGSAYAYAYATLGELFAWIIGWDLVLEYAVASSTVAHGWSHYFIALLALFGITLPEAWTSNPFDWDPSLGWHATGAIMNLPAALVVLLITIVLVIGIRESARFNAAMVILKVAVVLFVIVVGSSYVEPANWRPFLPYGVPGVMQGAAYIFFAYIGFDSVSTHAEEARNPQRDVPIGIIVSLLLCTVLYVAVALVLTGMVRYDQIDVDAPVAHAFGARGLHVAELLIAVGAVVGITSVLLVMLLSQARVLLAMARDGLIPRSFFAAVHPRFRTPHKATILTGVLVAVAAAVLPLKLLADLVNIGTLLAFVIVCAAVLVMRRTNPQLHRPFRTPFVPWVPIAGIVMNVILMLSLGWQNWLRLFVWLLLGFVLYFAYGRHHSVLGRSLLREETDGGISPAGRAKS